MKNEIVPILRMLPSTMKGVNHNDVTYSVLFSKEDIEKLQEDEHRVKQQEDLALIIKSSFDNYYNRYTPIPVVSKGVRVCDENETASFIIGELIRNNKQSSARVNISFNMHIPEQPGIFCRELSEFTIQWYETPNVEILQVLPIGFQTVHNCGTLDKDTYVSSVIFDLRTLQKDIESSLDFYIENAIPKLSSYFDYIKQLHQSLNQKECPLDFEDIASKLQSTINTVSQARLLDPANTDRYVVFLDVVLSPFNDSENIPRYNFSVHIAITTEKTETPDYYVTDVRYKASQATNREILHSFNQIPMVQKEIESSEQLATGTVANDSGTENPPESGNDPNH